jgi:hypothetical protein
MTTKTLDIDDLIKFEKAIAESPQIALPIIEKAMTKSLFLIQDVVATYPPATEANQPGRYSLVTKRPMGYYERGRGWWYPAMRQASLPAQLGKTRGAVKAKKITGVAGYKLAGGGKSELLGRKWTSEVETQELDGQTVVVGTIGNTVSYSDYVQGRKQNRLHGARGWPTLDATIDKLDDQFNAVFLAAADELLDALGGK